MFAVQLVTQKAERWPYMAVIKGISIDFFSSREPKAQGEVL